MVYFNFRLLYGINISIEERKLRRVHLADNYYITYRNEYGHTTTPKPEKFQHFHKRTPYVLLESRNKQRKLLTTTKTLGTVLNSLKRLQSRPYRRGIYRLGKDKSLCGNTI